MISVERERHVSLLASVSLESFSNTHEKKKGFLKTMFTLTVFEGRSVLGSSKVFNFHWKAKKHLFFFGIASLSYSVLENWENTIFEIPIIQQF